MAKKMLAALVAALMLMMGLVPSVLNAGTAAADSNSSFILHNNEQPYYDPTAPEVPKNKTFKPSVDANIWQNVYWEIANPDSGKRLRAAEGYSVTVNYELARPMLGQDESILLYGMAVHKTNPGETPRAACTYHVFFTAPQYEVYPLQPPEITVHQTVEPPAGFESWADGSSSPYPSEPTDAPPMGAQAEPVHLEVEYLYQDENGNDAGIIAPGWYLDNPEEKAYIVTFHKIAGYKATVDGEDRTSYTFDPPHESRKITVVYVPLDSDYTVKVYHEKLDGTYEIIKTETKSAKTGSLVDMDALCADTDNHAEGFGTPYYHEQPRVAGDGSTVAEIFLDRMYFLMDFDLGEGGFGVEPVYAKFEASIPTIAAPQRPGYTFIKWQLNGNDADIPDKMPAENRIYTAVWEVKSPARVTVNIWTEEANSEDYELYSSQTAETEPNVPFDPTNVEIYYCGKEEHTHTNACYSVVKKSPEQTSKEYFGQYTNWIGTPQFYYWDGGSAWGTTYPAIKDSFPQNPQQGDTFQYTGAVYNNAPKPSWHIYDNGTWYVAERKLTCGKEEHTHTPACRTAMDSHLWTHVRTEPEPPLNVNPDGSTVINYYYDRTEFTLTFLVPDYQITNQTAQDWAGQYGSPINWTGTNGLSAFLNSYYPYPVNGDTVVYEWLDDYDSSISHNQAFIYNNGTWYVAAVNDYTTVYTVNEKWGADIAAKWDAACDAGNCYSWKENVNSNISTTGLRTMPTRDITYYKALDRHEPVGSALEHAYYYGKKLDGSGYDLLYMTNSINTNPNKWTYSISDEDYLEFEGYTFERLDATPDSNSSGYLYDNSKFYYVRNTYKVIYKNLPQPDAAEDARFEQPLDQLPYNNKIAGYPANLEPDAYNFGGWYKDPTGVVPMEWNIEMPAKNIIVYAVWNPVNHKVTFRDDESAAIPTGNAVIKVPHGKLIDDGDIPEDPTKAGFDFVGWFYKLDDNAEHAFKPDEMPVRQDMNLYAKWKATGTYKYTVNYVLQNAPGTMVAEPTVGIGIPGDTFPVDAKKGYSPNHPSELFWQYWQFFTPTQETQNITLNADDLTFTFYYEEDSVTIDYQVVTDPSGLDGGTLSVTSETVGKVLGSNLIGSVPTANNGFMFEGWFMDEGCTQPVPDGWLSPVSGSADKIKLTPQRTFDAGVPDTGTSTLWIFEAKTYYAKFRIAVPDFTVTVEDKNVYLFGDLSKENLLEGAVAKTTDLSDVDYLNPNTWEAWMSDSLEVTTVVSLESFSDLTEDKNFTVTVTVKLKNTNQKKTASATGKINVFKPELTFKDSDVCYGGKAPADYSASLVKTEWKHGETVDTAAVPPMIGDAPTLALTYTPEADCIKTVNGVDYIVTRDDIPVKVTVEINAADATAHVKFIHQACTNETGCGWDTMPHSDPLDGDPAFLLHVKTCTLTVSKQLTNGKKYQPGESFIFHISGNNPALPIEMEVVAHVDENGNVAEIVIKELPVGSYTVTEDTGWSWRYEVTGENGVTAELKCEGGRAGTAAFTNNLVSNKWLTWEAAVDNRWGKDGDDPVIIPHTKPEP